MPGRHLQIATDLGRGSTGACSFGLGDVGPRVTRGVLHEAQIDQAARAFAVFPGFWPGKADIHCRHLIHNVMGLDTVSFQGPRPVHHV